MSDWHEHEWQGRTIAWRRLGSGPPLVVCHGTPWSSYVWEHVAEQLADLCTVHLWDMPGYGRSSKHHGHDVDLETQGRALAEMLRHWGLDRPHVLAHDIGGAVALRAHLLHACPMSSLVLVDAVTLRPWGSDFFRLVQRHASVFAQLPEPLHRGLVEAYVAGAARQPLDDTRLEALVSPWTGPEGRAAFYAQIAQADPRWTDEVVDRLVEVDTPTLVLWGRDDTWIPVEQADRLAAAIPGACASVIDDAGHLVSLDGPDAVVSRLRDWLGGVS